MKLDRTLVKEIKSKVYADGTRSAKFAALRKVKEAACDMSTTSIRTTFNDLLRKHGRAVTAICVAATLCQRKERIDNRGIVWANKVLELVPFFSMSNIEDASINDGIHPTAICEYAASLVRYTTEE